MRRAYEQLTPFGMEAFAERAPNELRATGVHRRQGTAEIRDVPRNGRLPPGKVFAKLGIGSRSQLARVLPTRPAAAPPVTLQG